MSSYAAPDSYLDRVTVEAATAVKASKPRRGALLQVLRHLGLQHQGAASVRSEAGKTICCVKPQSKHTAADTFLIVSPQSSQTNQTIPGQGLCRQCYSGLGGRCVLRSHSNSLRRPEIVSHSLRLWATHSNPAYICVILRHTCHRRQQDLSGSSTTTARPFKT